MENRGSKGQDRPARNQHALLLRVGELFLKGKNRPYFARRLKRNIEDALTSIPELDLDAIDLEALHDRMVLWHPPELEQTLVTRLTHVFGLAGLSPAVPTSTELDEIRRTALTVARTAVSFADPPPRTFRIQAHRSDKRHPYNSMQICRDLGAAIAKDTGLDVNLKHPDLTLEVEVATDRAFVFSRRISGPGGLPVGVSGKAALLLSGGIDSPVAGWRLMKRGLTLSAVTFHSPPYTGEEALEKVRDLCRLLADWGGAMRLHTVHFTDFQQRVQKKAPPALTVILYRRFMLRTAALIAQKEGVNALATGESLGQVASQTLENLSCIQQAVTLPVLRPLIAYDKSETVSLARRIGTYDISIRPHQDCCSLFVPKHPETKAVLTEVLEAEQALGEDPDELARAMADSAETRTVG